MVRRIIQGRQESTVNYGGRELRVAVHSGRLTPRSREYNSAHYLGLRDRDNYTIDIRVHAG